MSWLAPRVTPWIRLPLLASIFALAVGMPSLAVTRAGARELSIIRFVTPSGLAVDDSGNLYVSDVDSATVHKITPDGEITLLPGGAAIVDPMGIAADRRGNVFVAELRRHTVFRSTPDGLLMPAGKPSIAEPPFERPTGVAVDRADNVFVADASDATVRRISSEGLVTTFAGRHHVHGSDDGPLSAATFNSPRAVAVDRMGNVYVADERDHVVRKISASGLVSTIAGAAGQAGHTDGAGGEARFRTPTGIAVDGMGNVYVADSGNDLIRRISPAGDVSIFAGAAGEPGSADGSLTTARFRRPLDVAVDSSGNVYVADAGNRSIRQITPEGSVSTITRPSDRRNR